MTVPLRGPVEEIERLASRTMDACSADALGNGSAHDNGY